MEARGLPTSVRHRSQCRRRRSCYGFNEQAGGKVLADEPALGEKRAYDPRACGAKAESAMAQRVAQACEELGSAGRSIVS
jgi:fructose/tagatose bisphosphate aldolase